MAEPAAADDVPILLADEGVVGAARRHGHGGCKEEEDEGHRRCWIARPLHFQEGLRSVANAGWDIACLMYNPLSRCFTGWDPTRLSL